jgi:hypothetical protein
MKYSESILHILLISVVLSRIIFLGAFILKTFNISGYYILIPYAFILIYSIFKSKNRLLIFGLLGALFLSCVVVLWKTTPFFKN